MEAAAFAFKPQYIDIVSASYGPNDDGMSLNGPGVLALSALQNSVTKVKRLLLV
jgi:hypothetical protein